MSVGQDIEPGSRQEAYLGRQLFIRLPRDLQEKLVTMKLVQVNGQHDAFRVCFSTGQQAIIPASKMTDDATIARLCVMIR